jgi:phosphoribosylformylglycinamidine synthase subunit PurS
MTIGSDPRWQIDVVIMPKPGVNDPEGESILGGLRSLGYDEVRRVRSGKTIQLEVTAASELAAREQAAEMADRLLANPVIEVYEVTVTGRTSEENAA